MTSTGLTLRRNLGCERDLAPGEWCVDPPRPSPTGMHVVSVMCPLCERIHALGEQYAIAESGLVTPRYECPTCPFWERVTLDDWSTR